MLENVEDLLDRYFDKDLAASAVEGLRAYCTLEAAIYDLRGQRLWATKGDGLPALPASVQEDAALADAIERAKTSRTAVSAPHGETPRVIAPIMILEGPAGFLVLAPRLERAGTGNALQRLETLASMCGALFGEALTGKRTGADLAAELTARYEELSLVYTLTEALDISKPEHEALAIICDAVAHTLGADLLILEVPALGHCTFYPDSPEDTEARQQLAAALLEELAAAPRTTATNYLDQSEKYARIAKPFAHAACVPLTVDNDLGMIALLREDPQDRLFMGDVKMLEAVSRQLSIFMTNRKITSARKQLFDLTIFGLARLAESRDMETGEHLERVSSYCRILAEYCLGHGIFGKEVTPEFVETIFSSSPLHDIGKVGIPDAILNKPGKLTPEEFELMKQHAIIGGDTLRDIEHRLNWGESTFLTMGREIAYSHHEKWNGTGYPFGLNDDTIPLSGRVMAIADVYDALTSKRCYKDAMSHERARTIIVEGRGAHFDPRLVDAFLACEEQFLQVCELLHGGQSSEETARFLRHFATTPLQGPGVTP